MAIAKMKRFTLLTFRSCRGALLRELQRFGDVHLRDLQRCDMDALDFLRQDFSPEETTRLESGLDKVNFTLAKLAPYAPKRKMTEADPAMGYEEFAAYPGQWDYGALCSEIRVQDERATSARSEIARLKAESEGLRPWMGLDASPVEMERLESARALLGTVNKASKDALLTGLAEMTPCMHAETLGELKDDISLLLVLPAENFEELFAAARDLGFSRAALSLRDTPANIVEQNAARIGELERTVEEAQAAIAEKSDDHARLLIVRDCLRTELEREKASQSFLRSDQVMMAEGWVPADDEARFRAILESTCPQYHLELADEDKESTEVPIKLKNNKFVQAFESITAMYAMPRYNELDPTPILTPFYWLFFGLMVGDAGYGLLMLVGTGLALKFLNLRKMRGFIQFFFYLSFAVIFGGFIYGSAFGVTFFKPMPYVNELGYHDFKPILDSQNGDDIPILIVASIAIGVIHVLFGILVKGYMLVRDGKPFDAICDSLLWVLALVGGIGWLLSATGLFTGAAVAVCKWTFWGSLILLALTQGRESPSIGGKIGNGLYGVYGITGYVGDLVSYSRIAALALSGAYIAYSFNLMSTILPAGIVRILGGTIIVVLGQSLNLGLALLGAYVHTCRLQYVEFFGKFYEGGGKPFKPLKIENDYVQIKK